jgi:hypothetical protein
MKPTHLLAGTITIFVTAALLFLLLDLRVLLYGPGQGALPVILVHAALLTAIVGSWVWAILFLEGDELPGRRRGQTAFRA